MRARTGFELHEGIVHVPVCVNGRGPFWFNIDTGSSSTVISSQLASDLSVVPKEGGGASGAGSDFRVHKAVLDSISVGEARAEDLVVSVLNLGKLPGKPGVPVQGLIGQSFLGRFTVTVDYPKRSLALSWMEDSPAGGEQAPFRREKGLVILETMVNGMGPFDFVLDTGASMTAVSASLKSSLGLETSEDAEVRSTQNGFSASIVNLTSLEIGRISRGNLQSCVFDFSNLNRAMGCRFDGILGFNLLCDYAVTIDFQAGRVVFMR